MWRVRWFTTIARAPVGTPMSKITRRWSTASTTATGWKTSGSTSELVDEEETHELEQAVDSGSGGRIRRGAGDRRRGARGKARRRLEDVFLRQPRQHVDPRGSHHRRRGADDGGVQQPRHVRPAYRSNQHQYD